MRCICPQRDAQCLRSVLQSSWEEITTSWGKSAPCGCTTLHSKPWGCALLPFSAHKYLTGPTLRNQPTGALLQSSQSRNSLIGGDLILSHVSICCGGGGEEKKKHRKGFDSLMRHIQVRTYPWKVTVLTAKGLFF